MRHMRVGLHSLDPSVKIGLCNHLCFSCLEVLSSYALLRHYRLSSDAPVFQPSAIEIERERERERDFYSHKAGYQKGHAHQTWCLLFSNISMIFYTNKNQKRNAKGEKCNTKATKIQENGMYSTMNEYRLSVC